MKLKGKVLKEEKVGTNMSEKEVLQDTIIKLDNQVKFLLADKKANIIKLFLLENEPYKDGDTVLTVIGAKETKGILELVYTESGYSQDFCKFMIRPYKADGELSGRLFRIFDPKKDIIKKVK